MEFWSTIVGLLRRPVVIIPAVLAALTLGILAWSGTPKTYVSSATMVITTTEYGGSESQNPDDPTELTNPMLNFNASLQTTSAILIQTMATNDVLEQLGADKPTTRLIVNDGRTNPELLGLNGPFLYIEGRSISADDALRVVKDAQKVMQQKLNQWQRDLNAPEKTYVSLVDVVPPTPPRADAGRAMKLAVLASLFGFVLCVGIAYFAHQFRARRRARAAAAAAELDSTPPVTAAPEQSHHSSPSAVVSPDDDDEEAESTAVPTTQEKRNGTTRIPSTPKQQAEPNAPTPTTRTTGPDTVQATPTRDARPVATLKKKAGSNAVRVPQKVNGRSRNR
jgi:hypothetical protein